MHPSSVSRQILAYAAAAYQSQRYDEAVSYLEELIDVCPNDWQARLCLGSAYLKAGLASRAVQQFTYIAEHAPNKNVRELARHELKRLYACEAVLEITQETRRMLGRAS